LLPVTFTDSAWVLQSLTKCSRRATAGLTFGSVAHASRRFYANPLNGDIVNLDECASPDFHPSAPPTAFALTFELALLSVLVDRCGEQECICHENSVVDSTI
jgi:hypothetical protein